jgi:hypothetical protein
MDNDITDGKRNKKSFTITIKEVWLDNSGFIN